MGSVSHIPFATSEAHGLCADLSTDKRDRDGRWPRGGLPGLAREAPPRAWLGAGVWWAASGS